MRSPMRRSSPGGCGRRPSSGRRRRRRTGSGKLNRDRKRSAELDGLIKKLYEFYATDKLTKKWFELLSAEYEREQAELDTAIEQAQAELDAFNEDTGKAGQFLALAKKYTGFTELTTPMLHEFIKKILVHASDRFSGERAQEVEIHLKFIGRFDVPLPEPTPEELAEEERRRKRREANHRKYLRKKELERQKKLAAQQEPETQIV